MYVKRCVLMLLVIGLDQTIGSRADALHHSASRRFHSPRSRKHRAANDGPLRFEPELYNKKMELNSSGKIHCKVAGGVAPNITWYLNDNETLPEGVTSSNGTLLVTEASKQHAGQYTCKVVDGEHSIDSKIQLDIVVSPRVIEPRSGEQLDVQSGQSVALHCRATGDPTPTLHWDRNRTVLQLQDGVETEGGANASTAKYVVLNNGTLLINNVNEQDSDRYGCTAGSAAGLSRNELQLIVHAEGDLPPAESSGVAGKAVVVSISVAGAYMLLVLALMVYCRKRRMNRRQNDEKLELETVEGREKLVEDGDEEKKVGNGVSANNGRLLPPTDRDSGADNSEVSRASKKSGQFDHLNIPRSLLTEQITLGRGEFGEVLLAKIDMTQVKKLRNKDEVETEAKIKPVLVKVLSTKDEVQLAEFRRQLDMFSRIRHDNIVRLIGLCNDAAPHCMILEHTDWGDLQNFLLATRTAEEESEYRARVGPSVEAGRAARTGERPLRAQHAALLALHLAAAGTKLAAKRITHRDISSRNCVVTSRMQLKLSFPALTRGPHSHQYYKLHDQVIPLRWLPLEAVAEGEYSTKSDVYMFAATVWEIYTKAELPFAKWNDNTVLERLKAGTLDWLVPGSMPDPLMTLLKRCWSKSPSQRPHFTEVYEQMSAILKDMTSETASQESQDKIEESQDKIEEEIEIK